MAASTELQNLFSRLEQAGVDKRFVRKVLLPSWWKPSIASSQPGFIYTLTIVSSHLGVPVKVLADESKAIQLPSTAHARFKHNQNLSRDDVAWANSIALSAAKQIVRVLKTPLKAIPSDPKKIREDILGRGNKCVTLKALLAYLWEHGIPVIHVCEKPKHQKKMAGLAARIDGRPVIVCCKNDSLTALMVFLIAHELGHVVKHLASDGSVIDEKIDRHSTNAEEKEANEFAATLLTGTSQVYQVGGTGNITAERLAMASRQKGTADGVDPGVIAMSVAHGRDFYPVGVGACRIIEGDDADACGLIRSAMLENVDLSELPDEDQDFVRKACGCGESHALPVGY